jgi:acyl dehydratase
MALSAAVLEVGQNFTQVVVDDLTRTQIVQYAGTSGDYNPIHSDEVFATQVAGYPSVFAHGMLTMGITGKLLTDTVGDGTLTDYGVRFVNQVWPGDTLTATATVTALRNEDGQNLVDLDIVTVNQDDVKVLTGTATARCDP